MHCIQIESTSHKFMTKCQFEVSSVQNTHLNGCNLCSHHQLFYMATENEHRLLQTELFVTIQPDWVLIMFVGSTLIIPAVWYASSPSDY